MRKLLVFILLALIAGGIYYYYYEQGHKRDQDYLTLYGNVDVRQVDLGFRVSGRVLTMPFQEGDVIKQGELIGTLDKQPYLDQVRQAKATVDSTQVTLNYAEKVFTRRLALKGDGSISIEDFENALSQRDTIKANLEQAKAALGVAITNYKDTEVYAPNDGIILTRIREPGSVVEASVPIYTLSLNTPVWIRAFVDEPNLGNVYYGMPAEVYTDNENGKVYHAKIGFISPVAEFTPKTVESTQLRTDLVYRLRIYVDDPDHGLLQGMPVTVKLNLKKEKRSE
jgi:HlyD family secretion protein